MRHRHGHHRHLRLGPVHGHRHSHRAFSNAGSALVRSNPRSRRNPDVKVGDITYTFSDTGVTFRGSDGKLVTLAPDSVEFTALVQSLGKDATALASLKALNLTAVTAALAADPVESDSITDSPWFWPVTIGGSALVVGTIVFFVVRSMRKKA